MIYLGLGANLPDMRFATPRETLEAAMADLRELGIVPAGVSRWYESAPVPMSDQPWYVNAVCRVETGRDPADLLACLHRLEAAYGRVRGAPNAARVIDLDLLDYHGRLSPGPEEGTGAGPGERVGPAEEAGDGMGERGPVLPHPRMHMRAFVLLPLRDLAPDWRHPQSGTPIDALIHALDPGQQIRVLGAAPGDGPA